MLFSRRTDFFLRERREGREKERERNIDVWERNIHLLSFIHAPIVDQTCNLGLCPDLESNLRPFTLQDDVQPAEPQQSGQRGQILIELMQITILPWKWEHLIRVSEFWPGWCGSVNWVPACKSMGHWVSSQSRAYAWVVDQVSGRGHTRGNHTLMFLSSFSFPFPL